MLGVQHPDTATSLSDLAYVLLNKQGNYDEAELFFRIALVIKEQVLGTEHSDTVVVRNNLAELLKAKASVGRVRVKRKSTFH